MSYLTNSDIIFCDIDDTIITGWFTKVMHITWELFRNNNLSDFLMATQEKFNLYRVRERLRYILNNTKADVVFLTVRKHNPATRKMLEKIFPNLDFGLIELGTDYGYLLKSNVVAETIKDGKKNCILIDDSAKNRGWAADVGAMTFDPSLFDGDYLY